MKIILTVHQFLPDYFSGTEILTYETAKELKRRGHVVSVVTGFPSRSELDDADRFDRYVYDGIRVERFHHSYMPMGGQSNIQELEYNNKLFGAFFYNYLIQEKPDVVHFFHLSRLSAAAIDICNELGIKTVLTPTDFWYICPTSQLRLPDNRACSGPSRLGVNCLRHIVELTQPKFISVLVQALPDYLIRVLIQFARKGRMLGGYFQLIRALSNRKDFILERLNRIDRIVIPTQVMKSLLVQNGLDIHRTVDIPFGINLSHVKCVSKPDPSSTVLRLGFIGTLSEHKGVHVLLDAIKMHDEKPIDLKIYGNLNDFPNYVKKLKEIVQGDVRVEFCGTFPNQEMGLILSKLDALVVPSLWYENSPLVVYSAQSAKCPVIASNVAGIAEVIKHGKNGLLFEPGDVAGLANIIDNLLENRNYLQELSDNTESPPSMEEYVFRLLTIYRELFA